MVVLSAAWLRVKRRREMRADVWRNTTIILYHRSTDNLKYGNLRRYCSQSLLDEIPRKD